MSLLRLIRVLWVDDQFANLRLIKQKAWLNGLELIPFSNAEDAIHELKKNIASYDAAILDGIFFESEGLTGYINSEEAAFGKVALALKELENEKILPWFILSGQTTFTMGNNTLAQVFRKSKVYDKNSSHDPDLNDLWADIRKEVEAQPDYQLRLKYQDVFDACDCSYCDPVMGSRMLNILKRLDERNFIFDTNSYLTEVRKVVELLFKAFQTMGVLPNEIYGGSNFISSSKNFLTGRDKGYRYPSEIMHPSAAMCLDYILSITQDGSHSGGTLKYRVDEFIRSNNSDYLYTALVNMLCDLLVWFKGFADEHKSNGTNRIYAELIPVEDFNFQGEIKQDNAGNYICGDFILKYTEVHQVHKPGARITIKSVGPNKNARTKEKYPTIALSFELLS
jgi:hypothetical protein